MVKQTILLPFHFDKVVLSAVPWERTEEFDTDILKIKLLEFISNEELKKKGYKMKSKREIVVCSSDAKVPYFENQKIFKSLSSISLEFFPERDELVQVVKPYAHSIYKGEKDDIDWDKDFKNTFYYNKNNEKVDIAKVTLNKICASQIYKKIDENKTLYSQIIIIDSKGMLGNFILKKAFHIRGIQLRKNLINQCKKYKNFQSLESIYNEENYEKIKADANALLLYNLNIPQQRILFNQNKKKEKFFQKLLIPNENDETETISIENKFFEIEKSEDCIDEKEIKRKLVLNQKYFENNHIEHDTFKIVLKKTIMEDDIAGFIFLSNHKSFDYKIKYENEMNLMHLSSKYNSNQIFIYLMKSEKIDIEEEDKNNSRIIHYLCVNKNKELLFHLLEKGCEINPKDVYGKTPIYLSINNFDEEIINILLLSGSDLNMKKLDSKTILHDLMRKGDVQNLDDLLSLSVDDQKKLKINIKDNVGNTPLNYGIIEGNIEHVKLLLNQKDIKLDILNDNEMNILHLACFHSQNKMLLYLLENSDIKSILHKTDKKGYNCFHYSVISNSISCLCTLLDYNCIFIFKKGDLNHQDQNGDTPLHLAIKKNNLDIIYVLVINGADLNISNKKKEKISVLLKSFNLKKYIKETFENYLNFFCILFRLSFHK
jgi:ankyrin repeat protein